MLYEIFISLLEDIHGIFTFLFQGRKNYFQNRVKYSFEYYVALKMVTLGTSNQLQPLHIYKIDEEDKSTVASQLNFTYYSNEL